MPIPTFIHGITGRMGSEISKILAHQEISSLALGGGWSTKNPIIGGFEFGLVNMTLILDFSLPDANQRLANVLREQYAHLLSNGLAVLVGTTGLGHQGLSLWREVCDTFPGVRVLVAPNTSIGIYQLAKASREIAQSLSHQGFDIEITETHHRNKIDAPSGTARFLVEQISKSVPQLHARYGNEGRRPSDSIGISVVRGGGVLGEHVVRFISEEEELFIGHRAFSRGLFASGAISLSKWLVMQGPGFYELENVTL